MFDMGDKKMDSGVMTDLVDMKGTVDKVDLIIMVYIMKTIDRTWLT